MADLLAGLPESQMRTASLCTGWTVHDVAAHLITYLRFCQAKIYGGIVLTGADFDRLNRFLTRRAARRPSDEVTELLRKRAGSRVTIPRSGYDPVLADLVLHDLDIRHPLGIPSAGDGEERLWVTFGHLAIRPSPGFAMGSRLDGLRLKASDTGWTVGDGPLVRGKAEKLLLGISGRMSALDELDGDGVPVLRQRLRTAARPGPVRRLAVPLQVLRTPPPRERRSRRAVSGYRGATP
jgi:uncharacterized protein (TIGR03083 family)